MGRNMLTGFSADSAFIVWQKLMDLRISQDAERQRRFRSFLMVETNIMLAFAFTLSQAFQHHLIMHQFVFLILGSVLCLMGLCLARRTRRAHSRAMSAASEIRQRLRQVEHNLEGAPADKAMTATRTHENAKLRLTMPTRSGRRAVLGPATNPDRTLIGITELVWATAFVCNLAVMFVVLNPEWQFAMVKLARAG